MVCNDYNRSIASLMAIALCAACTPHEDTQAPSQQTPSQHASNGPVDMSDHEPSTVSQTHMAILDILIAGEKAALAKDPVGLTKAAQNLDQAGARPLAQTGTNTPTSGDDLAKIWIEAARALQPASTPAPYRGRVKGPAYRKAHVGALQSTTIEEVYYASEKAELTLKSLSGEPLNLVVTEQIPETENTPKNAPAPVCTLRTNASISSCQWLPLWTAKYTITISNQGQNPVAYILVTN